jgi:predicted alpha/beta hydrolase family esterase
VEASRALAHAVAAETGAPIILGGHSMGGALAAACAADMTAAEAASLFLVATFTRLSDVNIAPPHWVLKRNGCQTMPVRLWTEQAPCAVIVSHGMSDLIVKHKDAAKLAELTLSRYHNAHPELCSVKGGGHISASTLNCGVIEKAVRLALMHDTM